MNRKHISCAIILNICVWLSSFVMANTMYFANAHFCLPDASGQPSSGCTGPILSKQNVSVFADFYKNLPALNSNWNNKSRLVPFPSASTSHTPLNMMNGNTAALFDGDIYNPVVYNWGDISKLVYFGGSENEGQVLLPTPGWIKAAHQNGTAIFGTVFFSPDQYGGNFEAGQLDYMLTPDKAGHYPIADLLISVARQYGIDGYFINEETPYPDGKSQENLADFVKYVKQTSQRAGYPVKIEWYFVDGSDGADSFAANSIFVDYKEWGSQVIDNAISNGYAPAKVEYGINGASNSSVSDIPNNASAAMFAFSNVLAPEDDRKAAADEQYGNAIHFWQQVPQTLQNSNTLRYNRVSSNFFETDFNAGIGNDYYINGASKQYGFWSAIGLQDMLPVNLLDQHIALNFNGAYLGGSSLQVSADQTNAGKNILLYKNLHIIPPKNSILAVRYRPISGAQVFKICAHYVDGNANGSTCVNMSAANNKNWNNTSLANLPILSANGYYNSISLHMPSSGSNSIKIGQLYLGSLAKYSQVPDPVQNLQFDQIENNLNSSSAKHYVVSWKRATSDKYYHVYVNNVFYGVTYQNIEDVVTNATPPIKVCIAPQNYGGVIGDKTCIKS